MVARITSGDSPVGVLYYNAEKIERGEASFLGGRNTLLGTNETFDMRLAEETFAPYLAANRRTKQVTFHVSLNPSPEDRLTDGMLREIAREYMERMGYGAQPYFVFKHSDIAREHIHIVSLRVDADGRKLPHDFEARRSMEILRDMEGKYGLHPAVNVAARPDLKSLRKVDYTSSDIKRQLSSVVRMLLHSYHCATTAELRTLLSLFNVSLEEQQATIRGHSYTGVVYRATTDEGIHAGIPIRASDIGRDVGYDALQRYYERSAATIRSSGQSDYLRDAVRWSLQHADTEEEFVRQMERQQVTAVLRHTPAGRIYAATYIDHTEGIVMEGAQLGRDCSAYMLERHFNAPQPSERESVRTGLTLNGLINACTEEEFEQRQRRKRKKRKRRKS